MVDPIKSREEVVRRLVRAATEGMATEAEGTTAGEMLSAALTLSRTFIHTVLGASRQEHLEYNRTTIRNCVQELLLDTLSPNPTTYN